MPSVKIESLLTRHACIVGRFDFLNNYAINHSYIAYISQQQSRDFASTCQAESA